MGFKCVECGGVCADDGYNKTCVCCGGVAHEACASDWEDATKKGGKACNQCVEVEVTTDEILDELLRLYRLLPGHDETMDASALRTRLSNGRKSRLDKMREDDLPCGDGDEWLPSDDEEEEGLASGYATEADGGGAHNPKRARVT